MKFELTADEMNALKTGSLIERIRIFRNATGWSLRMSKDACEAIMSGRMKIEEFFTPKSPCPHCGGTGFVKGD
jgi:hypothetical protein